MLYQEIETASVLAMNGCKEVSNPEADFGTLGTENCHFFDFASKEFVCLKASSSFSPEVHLRGFYMELFGALVVHL